MPRVEKKANGISVSLGTRNISNFFPIVTSAMEYFDDIIKVYKNFFWKYAS